jgi:3,4-dihydroxy 2-butanone 4-phosphate synthase/GTP cyclohydrolase II
MRGEPLRRDWKAITFLNMAVDTETLVLVKGRIDPSEPTLVRMHALGVFSDALGLESDRSGLLPRRWKQSRPMVAACLCC